MFLKKYLFFTCLIFSLIISSYPASHGMVGNPDDMEGSENTQKRQAESPSKEKSKSDGSDEGKYQEVYLGTAPSKSALGEGRQVYFNKNEKHVLRKRLNNALMRVKEARENTHLLAPDDPPFETALLVFRLPPANEEHSRWDDSILFLTDLDRRFFNQPQSKKTWALKIVLGGAGAMAPAGIAPLVFYLGENLLSFIPASGLASNIIFAGINIVAAPPCGRLLWERGEIIGNALFDKNGIPPAKDDQIAHIYKGLSPKKGYIFATFNGTFRALPMGFLFWIAESYFPEYRAIFLGPLALVYFDMAYRSSQDYFERLNFTLKNEENYMVSTKKRILRDQLKKVRKLINGQKSDALVITLYNLIQGQLKKLEDSSGVDASENGSAEVNQPRMEPREAHLDEHISAISVFFLKHLTSKPFEEIEHAMQEHADELERSPASSKELAEVVRAAGLMRTQQMANTLKTIDEAKPSTKARSFFENFSIYSQGAGGPGRFTITAWALSQFLEICGLSEAVSWWSGLGGAAVPVILRTISEWYHQEEAALSARGVLSRRNDYWGARWATNIASVGAALFINCAPWGIVDMALGEATPAYVKFMICIAMSPSEFSDLFYTFREKWGNIIRGIATTFSKTTSQKRAYLNQKIDELDRLILRLDSKSTLDFYSLLQDAL
jgi:hypothetical protein